MKQQAKNPSELHLHATARVFRIRSVVLLLEREAKSDENVYRNTRGEAKSDNNEKNTSADCISVVMQKHDVRFHDFSGVELAINTILAHNRDPLIKSVFN